MKGAPTFVAARALDPEVARFVDRVRVMPDVRAIAVFPDVHLAGDGPGAACVGTAIATERMLVPAWLGSDLGCGVTALPIAASSEPLRDPVHARRALGALGAAVPILRHHAPRPIPELDALERGSPELRRHLEGAGRHELGTIGRGNHFVELRSERETGVLWALVHSGSRSLGPTLQHGYRARATARRGGWEQIEAASEVGRAYLHDVELAVAFARANRTEVLARALDALSDVLALEPDLSGRIDTHHDSVSCELHTHVHAEPLFVHRKGAMKLAPGELGLVPGSMGADVAIVRARDPGIAQALGSSAHGAAAHSHARPREGATTSTISLRRWRA